MSHTKRIQHKISQMDLQHCLLSWVKTNVGTASKENLVRELKVLRRRLAEMREKGGYVMVSTAGVDITIYKIY